LFNTGPEHSLQSWVRFWIDTPDPFAPWYRLLIDPQLSIWIMAAAFACLAMAFSEECRPVWTRAWILAGLLIVWFPIASVSVERYLQFRMSLEPTSISLWQDVVNKSPEKLRPRVNLAYALQLNGDLSEALREYRNAELLSFQERLTDAQREEAADRITTAISAIYIHLNRYNDAGKILAQRWNQNPGFPGVGVNLSKVLLHDQRPDMAVVVLSRTLAEAPAYPWIREPDLATMYLNRAVAFAMLGDCALAENDKRLAEHWPDFQGKVRLPECTKGF
jgi:tetratricopeptide (TPR) repeat protein